MAAAKPSAPTTSAATHGLKKTPEAKPLTSSTSDVLFAAPNGLKKTRAAKPSAPTTSAATHGLKKTPEAKPLTPSTSAVLSAAPNGLKKTPAAKPSAHTTSAATHGLKKTPEAKPLTPSTSPVVFPAPNGLKKMPAAKPSAPTTSAATHSLKNMHERKAPMSLAELKVFSSACKKKQKEDEKANAGSFQQQKYIGGSRHKKSQLEDRPKYAAGGFVTPNTGINKITPSTGARAVKSVSADVIAGAIALKMTLKAKPSVTSKSNAAAIAAANGLKKTPAAKPLIPSTSDVIFAAPNGLKKTPAAKPSAPTTSAATHGPKKTSEAKPLAPSTSAAANGPKDTCASLKRAAEDSALPSKSKRALDKGPKKKATTLYPDKGSKNIKKTRSLLANRQKAPSQKGQGLKKMSATKSLTPASSSASPAILAPAKRAAEVPAIPDKAAKRARADESPTLQAPANNTRIYSNAPEGSGQRTEVPAHEKRGAAAKRVARKAGPAYSSGIRKTAKKNTTPSPREMPTELQWQNAVPSAKEKATLEMSSDDDDDDYAPFTYPGSEKKATTPPWMMSSEDNDEDLYIYSSREKDGVSAAVSYTHLTLPTIYAV